ncbi:MAG: hypothetical protein AB7G75_30180 [Candidatus Binatia bacterium]
MENVQDRGRAASCKLLVLAVTLALVGTRGSTEARTIAELAQASEAFAQQQVTVIGEVADVVTRYGEKPYSTFTLYDAAGVSLPIFIWGPAKWKQGDLYKVVGTFVKKKVLGSYTLSGGIEADTVEKISEAELKTVSTVFKKKKKYGIKGTRGFYLPQ